MHKQLQDLVDVFKSDEDLKHLEIEVNKVISRSKLLHHKDVLLKISVKL